MTNEKKFLSNKWICIFTFALLLLFITNFARAEGSNTTTDVFEAFRRQLTSGSLVSTLQSYGKKLFILLFSAQLSWNFIKLHLDGKWDFQALFLMVLREIIVAGMFYYLAKNGITLFTNVINGFKNTGMSLSGLGGEFSPLTIVAKSYDVISQMWSTATKDPGPIDTVVVAIQLLIPTVFIVYAFVQVAMVAAVTYMRALVSAAILVYFLGFGGSDYTRDIAIASIKTVFMQAVELFTIIILVGIMNTVIPTLTENMAGSDGISWFKVGLELAFATFVMQGLVSSLPSMVSGVITGAGQSSAGSNAAMGQQMASLVAGAGAMAAGMAITGAGAGAGKFGSWGSGKMSNIASNLFSGANEVMSGAGSSGGKSDGGKGFVDFANKNSVFDKDNAAKAGKVVKGVGKATTDAVKGTGNFMQDFGSRMLHGESIGGALAGATGTSMKNLGYAASKIFSGKKDDSKNSLEAGSVKNAQVNINNESGFEGNMTEKEEVKTNSSASNNASANEAKEVETNSAPSVSNNSSVSADVSKETTTKVTTKHEEVEKDEPLTSEQTQALNNKNKTDVSEEKDTEEKEERLS